MSSKRIKKSVIVDEIRNIGKSQFSEKALIEDDALRLLKEELNWNVREVDEEDSNYRLNKTTPLLFQEICSSLRKLNPWINDDQIREVITSLEADTRKEFDVRINEKKYQQIRDGVDVTIKEIGSNRKKKARIIDFNDPENNSFTAISQLSIKNPWDEVICRPDILGFVNGIPLLFIEFKSPAKNPIEGYKNNYQKYKREIPQLFAYNAFCVFSNGKESKIGAVGSKYEFFGDWHRLKEGDKGNTDISILLRGVCNKKNFIDLFENFIIFFREGGGDPKKIIAKNHQFLGVNLAFSRYEKKKENKGDLGVFWHTQGSGKSYSMLFFAEKIKRKCGGKPIFVILSDRKELEEQIYDTFKNSGVLGVGTSECRVESREELNEKFKGQYSYIFSLIHKFPKDALVSVQDEKEIIIITDEAHRTQYGKMFDYMQNFLPKASLIAFTGTPLKKGGEKTAQKYGGYVSIYDFLKAIDDGVTVRLYYEDRSIKFKYIVDPKIDEDIKREFKPGELPEDWRHTKQLLSTEGVLMKKAEDFVIYYSERLHLGKAMYVCRSKIMCVLMKNYIKEYWKKECENLKKFLETCKEEEIYDLRARIEEMERTEMEVVVSDGGVDEEDIEEGYGLENIELPPMGNDKELAKRFKDKKDPFKVVFVCGMWMTGFDVKCLSFLFLDRGLKEHSLMQAIARPNRRDDDKDRGFVIDYWGREKELRDALKEWGLTDVDSALQKVEEIIKNINDLVWQIESFLFRQGVCLKSLLEKTPEGKRKSLPMIKEKLLVFWIKEEFNKKCSILFNECKYVMKRDLNEIVYSKIDGIRAIHTELNTIDKNEKNSWQAKLTKILNKYIKANVSKENLIKEINKDELKELSSWISNAKNKQRIVEDIQEDLLPRIEKLNRDNPTLNKDNPYTINFFKEYNEIIKRWNNSVDIEKREESVDKVFEDLINLGKKIEEESIRFLNEGFKDVQELVIYDICRARCSQDDDILLKLKEFSVQFLKEMKSYLMRIYEPFGKDSTIAEVKRRIKLFIFSEFPVHFDSKSEKDLNKLNELRDEIYEYLYKIFHEKWINEKHLKSRE